MVELRAGVHIQQHKEGQQHVHPLKEHHGQGAHAQPVEEKGRHPKPLQPHAAQKREQHQAAGQQGREVNEKDGVLGKPAPQQQGGEVDQDIEEGRVIVQLLVAVDGVEVEVVLRGEGDKIPHFVGGFPHGGAVFRHEVVLVGGEQAVAGVDGGGDGVHLVLVEAHLLGRVEAGHQGNHRQQQDDYSVFAPKGRALHRDLRFKHRDNRMKNQLFI